MADKTISADLNALLYTGVAAGDCMVIDDIDAVETKRITAENVAKYVLQNKVLGGSAVADITTNNGTQTLTGKRLTSPKLNEDVAVSASATEVNVLDGIDTDLTAADLSLLAGLEVSGMTNAAFGTLIGMTQNVKTLTDSMDANYGNIYMQKAWCYALGFTQGAGNTKTITADTMLTQVGVSTTSYRIAAESVIISVATLSGGTYTQITDCAADWVTATSGGQIYLDNIVVGGLTTATVYSVSVHFKIIEITGI